MSNGDDFIFGSQLRMIRERANLTQAQLGGLANIPPTSIAHFESGSRLPSYESLVTLCVALNVPADLLMFGKERDFDLKNRAMAFNRIAFIVGQTVSSMKVNALR